VVTLQFRRPLRTATPDRMAGRRYWYLPFALVQATSRLLRLWRSRARERRALARFSERDMRDLGLNRMDIVRECEKPFWRK
jgi:uncharacterized protein YjiS (DUF1127 family)